VDRPVGDTARVTLAVEWISDAERFAALEPEWDALLDEDAPPFDRHCWHAAWWAAFGAGRELALCTARRDGALAAALPLARDARGRLSSTTNAHTPTFGPVGRDAEAVAAVLRAALDERAPVLELHAIDAASETRRLLDAQLVAAGARPVWHPIHRSPHLATDGAYEDWRKRTRPKGLERLRRKMARDHEARFAIAQRPADPEGQLERGLRLEAAGWKGRAGTAILSDEAVAGFYRRIAAAFGARDEVRLTEIVLDGELVAFELCLLAGRRLYELKTAYDEAQRPLRPGRVLQLATIDWCFAQPDVDVLEMLGTDEDWKRPFADDVRPHHELRVFPPTLVGRARHMWWAALRPRLAAASTRPRRAGLKAAP
jgi:CelD/BcsL family acetyltransferase involved in cellulose biosynthesis